MKEFAEDRESAVVPGRIYQLIGEVLSFTTEVDREIEAAAC